LASWNFNPGNSPSKIHSEIKSFELSNWSKRMKKLVLAVVMVLGFSTAYAGGYNNGTTMNMGSGGMSSTNYY
jgi:hypothetical protein